MVLESELNYFYCDSERFLFQREGRGFRCFDGGSELSLSCVTVSSFGNIKTETGQQSIYSRTFSNPKEQIKQFYEKLKEQSLPTGIYKNDSLSLFNQGLNLTVVDWDKICKIYQVAQECEIEDFFDNIFTPAEREEHGLKKIELPQSPDGESASPSGFHPS